MPFFRWTLRVTAALAGLATTLIAASNAGMEAVPFASPSAPRGATMFTVLPAEQTGLVAVSRYDNPQMWGEKFREFTYGSVGTGIAIGDYDGDGRPDVFVVCKTGSNRLFRNLGDWRFEDVTAKAGIGATTTTWNAGATFADVNNDGRLDLYVCRFDEPNLLFINQGDGTFRERARSYGLDVKDACGMASFHDYDRDGWLDVVIDTNLLDSVAHPEGRRDYLFRNRGDGTFENVTAQAGFTGEKQGHSATWWDFDNDQWPDLYVANDYATPDQLYHNNGNGTFTNVINEAMPRTPFFAMGADFGDVNNDGLIDFLVADMDATTHEKDHRGMLEMRAKVAADVPPGVAPQSMHSALYLSTDTGRFLEAAYLAGLSSTDWTWSPRLEDFDNDGRLDLHVTNGMVRDFFNSDLLAKREQVPPAQRERLIVTTAVLDEQNRAFRNRGDLQFEDVSAAWGLDQFGVSSGAAAGDLDGDGDLDLVFANFNANVTVCRNDSDTGHRVILAFRGTTSNRFGIGATARIETAQGVQVRTLALARGYFSTSEPIAHFGLGTDAVIQRLTVTWPSGNTQVFENLAADQRYTITEPEGPAPALIPPRPRPLAGQFVAVGESLGLEITARERPSSGELAAQPLLPFRHNRFGPGVAISDLDADGVDDVLLGGIAGDPPLIMLNVGGGFLPGGNPVFSDASATADSAPLVLDADGDGNNDLFIPKGGAVQPANSPSYQPRLYYGRGSGFFREAPEGTLPELPSSTGAAVSADFDRDGRLDIFVGARLTPGGYPLAPRSALWRNEGGKFTDVTDSLAPGLSRVGLVTSALWTDADADGWLDLLVALEWGGVRCWRNIAGQRFEDWSQRLGFESGGSGWWNSLAAADFNGDGRLDYAAGNLGLNTKYRATAEHPALLYSGVFEDGGRPQLIEAQYEGDRLVPLRGRPQVAAVIKSVGRRFPTMNAYAAASLEQIFTPEKLAAAQRFAATQFQSGVFLSQPDGRFVFAPLPRIAQIAPIFGLVAGDFDGDSFADLYGVQNSYAPIPERGRFEGGLSQLLRGDGRGHFAAVPVRESGLLVRGDAKALALADFNDDGWPDFFVTRNNDSTLVFGNNAVPGHRSFRIVLRGLPGNPGAIGALITVVLADGTTQAAEIHAGGGYLSQSTASAFAGYRPNNPPREIRVRWPSGQSTTHAWSEHRKTIRIAAPAP